jgi:quercetin dioxygenase-like cupin family protein
VGRPIVRRTDERVLWRAGVETRLHAAESLGAQSLCVIEQWCAPGASAPTHEHDVEEVVAVVAGVAEFWVDGERARVAAGDSIVLPAHSRHGFRNDGDAELHTFAVFASARPLVAYDDDPTTVLTIGVTSDRMLDAHRAHHTTDNGGRT